MARAQVELNEFLGDPIGALERARSIGWLADLGFGPGVLTYDDFRELVADPRLRANFTDFLRAFGVTAGPFYEWMSISPLDRDGPEHQRWRALMSRTFTPRRVEQIRPFLGEAAHGLIDRFAARGTCEFMGEFADAYPSLGLCELIGVPAEDRDRFREWANTIGYGFNPVELAAHIAEVDAALVQLLDYTGELVDARRREPRDDLVSRLAQAADEEGVSRDDVRSSIAGLVFAGHETTKNQLGWTVSALAGRDDLWDAVTRGETSAADVVEEVLRYRSTVTGIGRRVTEPVEHKGERLEAGAQVLLSIWGANHDERAFPHPDELDLARNAERPHLAFGHGAHHCLGAALARAELQEALAALTARISCPRLLEGARWRPYVGITGPLELPIAFAAR